MTSICTLLKKGPKYGTKDVNNIFRSLKKHTTKPFKFYCYTDYDTEFLDEDINIIELENDDKTYGVDESSMFPNVVYILL